MVKYTSIARLWAVALVLLICGTNATAQQQPAQQQDGASVFKEWDRNADGRLSKDELPEGPKANFARADRDNSGFISLEEHLAYLRSVAPRRKSLIPDNVTLIADIPYAGTDNARQTLHLLIPKDREDASLPVIAFIHGGAWRAGDKQSGLTRIAPYVASGKFAGVSIGYRLSNEATWPTQIHDCKAAIRWIRGNAQKYGLDGDRIAAWGSSAGGHLVSMLGVSNHVLELEGNLGPYTHEASSVNCVVNFFGPSNLTTMNDFPSKMDHNSPDSPESRLIGGAIPKYPGKALAASPETYISADDSPIIHFHGTRDELVPFNQSVQFDKQLKSAGVESVMITVQEGGHGFGGPEIDRLVRAWLESRLLGEGTLLEDQSVRAGR